MSFPEEPAGSEASGGDSIFLNRRIHMVGIKGTGMAALAEILKARGSRVSGSDVEEEFYTDAILRSQGIPFTGGFSPENVPEDAELVIHSAAYGRDSHPELLRARERGIPLLEYTEALGELSRGIPALGIAGVHGKTTTTALAGSLVQACELPGTVLAGSGVTGFGNRSTLILGNAFFAAETCEYRRHFLRFHPDLIILTSVEPDHLDYFRDYRDILSAFVEYILRLPPGGVLIFCADEPGAVEAAGKAASARPDIRMVPYGRKAEGAGRITEIRQEPGKTLFRLAGGEEEYTLRIPGEHTVLNAAAALLAVQELILRLKGEISPADRAALVRGTEAFAGSRRRSEILGEAGGILFMDDYAHHPSAVETTLKGFREFFPHRRLVVDFMSHTYSRTRGLFDRFCSSFDGADAVILHKIYPSAREAEPTDGEGITGKTLYERVAARKKEVYYFHEPEQALDFCLEYLKPGDLFLTMGAGNNWVLGKKLLERKRTESL